MGRLIPAGTGLAFHNKRRENRRNSLLADIPMVPEVAEETAAAGPENESE